MAAWIAGQLSSSENIASWLDTSTACPVPVRLRRERGEDADRAVEAGHEVAERATAAGRRRIREARDGHEAARRLRDDVVRRPRRPRPGLPEAREARDDEPPVLATEALGPETPRRERPAREVLDQDVDVREQLAEEPSPFVLPDVERDAFLVAIEREERHRHAVRRRIAVPSLVAAARRLHLDHLGAEVGQDRGAERPGEEARQVEDADAGERAHRYGTKFLRAERSASRSA